MVQRFIALLVMLCSVLTAQGVIAHPDGHAPIDDQKAMEIASLVAVDLADRDAGLGFGQLDPSWKSLPSGASKIHVKRSGYYIVSLRNEGEGKTLFVLMSNLGDVYDANFSGEFPGLDE